MSALRMTLALSLAGLSSVAMAAGWGDLGDSFPLYPCNDGWVACLVDGQAQTPGMTKDSAGRPMPSDLRVGFFDLQPTAALSPFVSLSSYTGELPSEPEPEPAVADAQPEAAPPPAGGDTAEPPAATNNNSSGGSVADAGSRSRDDGQAAPAADPEPSSTSRSRDDGASANAGSDEGTEASGGSVRPDSTTSRSRDDAASGGSVRPDSTSTSRSRDAGSEGGGSVRPQVEGAIQVSSSAPASVPAADGSCDNLMKLEPMAMMGKLNDGQVTCLKAAINDSGRQTEKNKISRVLMANHWAAGDKKAWEAQVKYHLDEIDKSDPDLSYKYALHLSRRGSANGAIKWADVALERRSVWTGKTYVSRVFNLYKIKAAAAQGLWKKAEEAHASAPTDQTKADTEKYRNKTKVFAREWYDYAKESGQDPSNAMALCMAAAGTRDYCEGS